MIRRTVAIVALFAVVALVAPNAAQPGVNSADLICLASPFLFLALVRRHLKTPAGDAPSPQEPASPSAESPAGSPS